MVAEGVEDAATWQELQKLGCDNVQGFYLGRPMSAADPWGMAALAIAGSRPNHPAIRLSGFATPLPLRVVGARLLAAIRARRPVAT